MNKNQNEKDKLQEQKNVDNTVLNAENDSNNRQKLINEMDMKSNLDLGEDTKSEEAFKLSDKTKSDEQKPKRRPKKAISRIMLFVMAFIIGLLLVIQLNTAEKVTGGLSTSQRALQLQTELKNLRIKREDKEAQLKALEDKINELTLSESSPEEIGKQLKDEIARYDIIIGNTEAIGPGIRLTMTDKNEGNLLINNYELVLAVINKLNAAGAEAISLNGIRWSTNSYLNLNKGLLYIDENPIKAPIIIEAIGDSDTLEASLNLRFGILHDLRNSYEIDCNIEKVDKLTLPKLTQKISFEYGKPEVK